MKKISLVFVALALLALFFADIEIVSLSPLREVMRMGKGFLFPRISIIPSLWKAIVSTLIFAFCGITLGVLVGSFWAPLYHFRIVRYLLTFIRSIHELFWAFLLMPLVGLNAVCGVLAIAIPYSAIFAKRFAEIYAETDLRPFFTLPPKAHGIVRFLYGALPLLWKEIKGFTSYRFECALRSSAVLGFIGLPTMGYHLESFFREGYYAEAFALLFLFYCIVATKKYWLHVKLVPLYVVVSFFLIPKEVHILPENIQRFFTYDIVPWPMRKAGFIDGSDRIHWAWPETVAWFQKIFHAEILPALKNTVVLTQISLVGAGLFALLAIFCGNKRSSGLLRRFVSKIILLISRTTPEYIIAYVAIILWGPSMLPGIVALVVHNGAVVAILTIKSVESLPLPSVGRKKLSHFCYEILPQVYGIFLGHLFYRWEVMVRESALLGILGIYTLGFYIDSAIADDKMDKTLLIIFFMALLNIGIDSISQRVRRAVRV